MGYERNFDGQFGQVTTDHYVFSPGILRIGDMVFEKSWKVSDLAVKDKAAMTAAPTQKKTPQMTDLL